MKYFFLAISVLLFLSSCSTRSRLVYFQDKPNDSSSVIPAINRPTYIVFEKGDLINIQVTCDDPILAVPYNLPPQFAPQTINNGYVNGIPATQGYLIDDQGNITFPNIGKIKIDGLNVFELKDILTKRLSEHLSKPVVQIRLLNFKISVLGDVRAPGTFTIPNDRITLFEALALAGDLNITASRSNVLLIRTINGKPTKYTIDITNDALIDQDLFYLKQNDVLYLEPNAAARLNSTLFKQSSGIFLPMISILLTTIVLFKK